ncbi:MAG: hypothetical protein ABIV05_06785 [Actinomycetota bacterium]
MAVGVLRQPQQLARLEHVFDSTLAATTQSSVRRELARLGERLVGLDLHDESDGELVALLGELESLKCRVEGAQVAAAAALDCAVRAAHAASGVPADRQGQGVGLQVALARAGSPIIGVSGIWVWLGC